MKAFRNSPVFTISFVLFITALVLTYPCLSYGGLTEDLLGQPFQSQTTITIPSDQPGVRVPLFHVPDGKRLIIEFVTAEFNVPTNQTVFLVMTTEGGGLANFLLLVNKQATTPTSQDVLITSQLVRAFADPGTEVALTVTRDPSTGGVLGSFSLAGVLVKAH